MTNRIGRVVFPLVAPAVFLVVTIGIVPRVIAAILSLFKIRFFSGGTFVGVGNYISLFKDPEFWNSLGITLLFSLSSVALCMVLAIGLALLFDKLGKYGIFLLSVLLIPWIISRVATGLLWKWILDSSQSGLLNYLLSFANAGPFPFLTEKSGALASLVLISVWRTLGYAVVLVFAGLKNIPRQILNAAKIDGATPAFSFMHVIFPLLKHTILVVLSLLTLSYFNEIDLVVSLTNGGPISATTTLPYLVYMHSRINLDTGYANALAVTLFVISMALVLVYNRLLKAKKYY
jgi:multiple sugar transport system permease protein